MRFPLAEALSKLDDSDFDEWRGKAWVAIGIKGSDTSATAKIFDGGDSLLDLKHRSDGNNEFDHVIYDHGKI